MSQKSCQAGSCFVLVEDFKNLCLTFSYRSVSRSSWGRQITSDKGSFKPRYLLWLKALIHPHCSLKQQEWHKHYPIFLLLSLASQTGNPAEVSSKLWDSFNLLYVFTNSIWCFSTLYNNMTCFTQYDFLFLTSQSCLCYPGTSSDFRWDSARWCKYQLH